MTTEDKWDPDSSTGCCDRFKKEFRVKNFCLEYDRPGEFGRANCGVSPIYLLWRIIWAAYNISVIGVSAHLSQFYASSQENRLKWPIFLTNWGLVFNAITSTLELIIAFYMYCNRRELLEGKEGPMPWYCKAFWVLANISNAKAIVVSFVYWPLLFDPTNGFSGYRILPFLSHGMNLIYMILNLLVSALPVRLLHFYFPLIVCFVYMVFNAVYVVAGGVNDVSDPFIYPVMNWKVNPGLSTGVAVVALVGAIAAHVIVYLIHLFRVYAFACCRSTKV